METTQKQIVLGILAHVDSGKTTLSEAMLYRAGAIRKLGRVDHGDAFLDTDSLEKARGITIFSKQALLTAGNTGIPLLDTQKGGTKRAGSTLTPQGEELLDRYLAFEKEAREAVFAAFEKHFKADDAFQK